MTAPVRFPRFFVTSPAPCPYLPGRSERKVFTELKGPHADQLNEALISGLQPHNNRAALRQTPTFNVFTVGGLICCCY